MTFAPSLRSRFQGCLVGAVVGDCIGAPFEVTGVKGGPGSYEPVLDFINKLGVEVNKPEQLKYTDDTAMARCVAESLIANKGSMEPRDLAKRFAEEFQKSPNRGYGANVIVVLQQIGEEDIKDVFQPAKCQFDGSGSYGNGGAMRVAPVGLCGKKKVDEVIEKARTSALLTHSNKLGYNGAILQALAVHHALHTDHDKMDPEKFTEYLYGLMEEKVETAHEEETESRTHDSKESLLRQVKRRRDESVNIYCDRLKSLKTFLKSDPSADTVASVLGNRISAHNSVGSALYSFLRCLKPVEGIPTENKLERTIAYAISLDGDTDTIASMAGAIAGAFYGVESVPEHWLELCEGCHTAIRQADELYEIFEKEKSQE